MSKETAGIVRSRRAGAAACGAALLALSLFATPAGAASLRLPEGAFGSAAQPSFSQPEGLAVDQSTGELLVIDAHRANEKRELKIEAASGLGGTYKLTLAGKSSGWSGTGTLEGESGTGDISGFEGEGKIKSGSNLIEEVTTISGSLAVGQKIFVISGFGIPNGTEVVEKISSSTFKLSQNATASSNVRFRAGLTTVANLSGGPFLAGQAIEGLGIPENTKIESVGAGTLTLSQVPTAAATGAALVAGSTAVTGLSGAGLLSAGLEVSGAGIQPGTTIASVGAGEASFTLSKPPSSSGVMSLDAELAFSAPAEAVEKAVEKLSPLAAGGVSVSGSASASPVTRTLEFKGRLAGSEAPVACDGSGLTGTSHSCALTRTQAPAAATITRWHSDGTPAPFADLGTNTIDAKGTGHGPGSGGACAPVSTECDETPDNRFEFGAANKVQVAVAPPGSPAGTAGDIYVAQAKEAVDVFAPTGRYLGRLVPPLVGAAKERCGVAAGPEGHVFVDSYTNSGPPANTFRVYEYTPTANPPQVSDLKGEFEPLPEHRPSWGGGSCTLAAGAGPSTGSVFATTWGFGGENGNLFRIDLPSGAFPFNEQPFATGVTTVSVDPATGRVFAAEGEGASSAATEYDATGGKAKKEVEVKPGSTVQGLAVDEATNRLYLSRSGSSHLEAFSAPIPTPTPLTGEAGERTETSATLNGTVNPEGNPLTECSFQHTTDAAFKANDTDEVQSVAISGATGGGFNLSYEGKATGAKSTSGTPILADSFTVSPTAKTGIFLLGELLEGEGIKPNTRIVSIAGGLLTLSRETETEVPPTGTTLTAKLPYDVSAKTLQAALEALPPIGEGNVAVSEAAKGNYRIEFTSELGHTDVPQLVPTSSLEGGTLTVTTQTPGGDGWGTAASEACAEYETGGEWHPLSSLSELGEGTNPIPVRDKVTGLAPSVLYHVRLSAANFVGAAHGADVPLSIPPLVEEEWVASVTASEALLEARIDPEYYPTTFEIEYGVGAYDHATAAKEVGADGTPHTVFARLQGLAPGKSYQWRVAATNSQGETTQGPGSSFATYAPEPPEGGCANQALRSGPSAFLPDCRAYEMVSPVDKGGDIVNEGNGVNAHSSAWIIARPDGGAISYSAAPAFGDQPSSRRYNQYLATRGSGGWANHGLNAPLGRAISTPAFSHDIGAISPDLCSEWLTDLNYTPLSAGAQEGYANLYRRQNCGPGADSFEALSTAKPPFPTTNELATTYLEPEYIEGFSADASRSFFIARAALSEGAVPYPYSEPQIYEHSTGGGLRLVSVLPSGLADEAGDEVGGGAGGNLEHAVSAGAGRVYWSAGIGNNGKGKLYLRENPSEPESEIKEGHCVPKAGRACTIAVSASGGATFWDATPSGDKALYSEGNLGEGKATLYEFDLASRTSTPLAGGLYGVAGASEGLSRIYLVSSEALAVGAKASKPNLYLDEEGELTFVGTLLAGDVQSGDTGHTYSLTTSQPLYRATRVSPDGRRLAFESRARLTGYDNTDAANGEADLEVFRYEAGGSLLCASCNPAGARPVGRELARAYTYPSNSGPTGIWAAAWIPGPEHPLHASSLLSENGGRLFFHSLEALVPRDTNGAQDLYEWEAPGEGSCTAANPAFHAADGGCLYLISSGESPEESEFWDASADGSDVFFTTNQSLVPRDPGSVDLYDARVGGGVAEPEQRAACEGEACQSPPPASSAQSPSSASYRGPGNLPASAKPRCPKGKREARRHGKTRCVAKQHKKKPRTAK